MIIRKFIEVMLDAGVQNIMNEFKPLERYFFCQNIDPE